MGRYQEVNRRRSLRRYPLMSLLREEDILQTHTRKHLPTCIYSFLPGWADYCIHGRIQSTPRADRSVIPDCCPDGLALQPSHSKSCRGRIPYKKRPSVRSERLEMGIHRVNLFLQLDGAASSTAKRGQRFPLSGGSASSGWTSETSYCGETCCCTSCTKDSIINDEPISSRASHRVRPKASSLRDLRMHMESELLHCSTTSDKARPETGSLADTEVYTISSINHPSTLFVVPTEVRNSPKYDEASGNNLSNEGSSTGQTANQMNRPLESSSLQMCVCCRGCKYSGDGNRSHFSSQLPQKDSADVNYRRQYPREERFSTNDMTGTSHFGTTQANNIVKGNWDKLNDSTKYASFCRPRGHGTLHHIPGKFPEIEQFDGSSWSKPNVGRGSRTATADPTPQHSLRQLGLHRQHDGADKHDSTARSEGATGNPNISTTPDSPLTECNCEDIFLPFGQLSACGLCQKTDGSQCVFCTVESYLE